MTHVHCVVATTGYSTSASLRGQTRDENRNGEDLGRLISLKISRSKAIDDHSLNLMW